MKIDSHQHFWKYTTSEFGWINDEMKILRCDYLPQNLKQELQSSGFDGSIAVQARQSVEETRWLLKLADENNFIKGVVGWVDLCSHEAEKQIAEFSHHKKFVGVRHIVQDEPDEKFLLNKNFLHGIEILQRYNLTYDILIYPKHLRTAITFVEKLPQMRLVLDHCAKPLIKKRIISPWKEELAELAQFPNIFCKVSGLVTEADWKNWKSDELSPYLDVVFNLFGPERTMIGSDWPVCTLAGSYSSVMSSVLEYIKNYTEEDKQRILGKNATKAYQLK